jgi:Xaa-Pro dipeptidase
MASRVEQLEEQMRIAGVDCVALVPGPNMVYVTGLPGHLSERPTIAFFPLEGQPALLVPGFEAIRAGQVPLPIDWVFFTYSDEEGPADACARACDFLGLAGKRLAVERFTMRVLELEMVQRNAARVQIVPAESLLTRLRVIKDEVELEQMRQAVSIAQQALTRTLSDVRVGMTEREIASVLMVNLLEGGSEGAAFTPLVQIGPNSASPHGATSDRRSEQGDVLLIDFGAQVGGYFSDITRTFALGEADPEMLGVYDIVKAANAAGRAAAGPGVACQEVDRAARRVIEEAGFGEFFIHRTGHGLGLEVHEPPYIVKGNGQLLEAGMTFTVEPGIYLPGRGGIRIEDNVVITPDGGTSLTTFERSFQVVG